MLHGPSLDDGVCMEIGYAAAREVPIVILTTDFITYALTEHGPELTFPDPLIQTLASHIVHAPTLGPPHDGSATYPAYRQRNTGQLASAVEEAVTALLQLERNPHPPPASHQPRTHPGDGVFCEPCPYTTDQSWTVATSQLAAAGHRIHSATRLTATDPLAAAADDWATLAHSAVLLADTSGPETPPGAALMIGAFAATGRPAYAHHPRSSWTLAHGREPNWRNLMIQYAVRPWPATRPPPRPHPPQ